MCGRSQGSGVSGLVELHERLATVVVSVVASVVASVVVSVLHLPSALAEFQGTMFVKILVRTSRGMKDCMVSTRWIQN